ncbi:type II CAAX prenyl endopeptidase Rce1 family protein [Erythrobacter sp. WG]|uniref:CPBP family glutamic-type intramembrane protease n=1 Tax=Erythrobacter sp. WG TaxID=2985510 RepID=UPI002270670B|nr:CPBP family glutamic-type intramembrane protease [Erythrobacter sp. WG]MCX9148125.1 CPBP family glutamic-type intramembrane protease [Erythrobacter sp. WG]
MPWGRDAALALAAVFAAACALDRLLWCLIGWWDAQAGFLPPSTRTYDSVGDMAFKALLLAPVLEEALFRGWMSGRVAALRFAAYGFGAMACFIATSFTGEGWGMALSLGGVALVFSGLLIWLDRRGRETDVPGWFTRHFPWAVWGSSCAFALIHLGNYAPITDPRGVLVITPLLIGALVLAYVRTRLGLGAAMLYHAAYNTVWLASEYGWL